MSGERDLLAWLRAHIDADEQVARGAPPSLDNSEWPFWVDVDDPAEYEAAGRYRDHFRPSRMLREIQAKRLRLATHQRVGQDPEDLGSAWTNEPICDWCTDHWAVREGGGRDALVLWPCPDIRSDLMCYGWRPPT